jgi:hypothetical protein
VSDVVPGVSPTPPAPDKPQRGCLATFVVLAVMLLIVGGGAVAADAVAGLPDPPITVVDGLRITPYAGWEFGGRIDDGRTILLSRGDGSLAVTVPVEVEPPQAALERVIARWRTEFSTPLTTGAIEPSDIRPGQPSARVSYAGAFDDVHYPVEGELVAVRGTDLVVVFDGWAGEGDFALVRDQIRTMIQGATIP